MKNLILPLIVYAVVTTPVLAVPTIEFSPGTGGWSYAPSGHAAGTFSFSQTVPVNMVLGNTADSLVSVGFVHVPDLILAGDVGGPYSLTPVSPIEIRDADDNVLLAGILGLGDLVPVGPGGVAYTEIKADITSITVTNTIGSDILDVIALHNKMDFNLTILGNGDIGDMLDAGFPDSGDFVGTVTIAAQPAPGAVLLASIGIGLVGWLRRRRTI